MESPSHQVPTFLPPPEVIASAPLRNLPLQGESDHVLLTSVIHLDHAVERIQGRTLKPKSDSETEFLVQVMQDLLVLNGIHDLDTREGIQHFLISYHHLPNRADLSPHSQLFYPVARKVYRRLLGWYTTTEGISDVLIEEKTRRAPGEVDPAGRPIPHVVPRSQPSGFLYTEAPFAGSLYALQQGPVPGPSIHLVRGASPRTLHAGRADPSGPARTISNIDEHRRPE